MALAKKIWVGIDEAGYGPKIGPLCVGLVALPGIDWQEHFWERPELNLSQDPKVWRQQLVVCDSKELHLSSQGLERLETSARALVPTNHCLRDWLEKTGKYSLEEYTRYPWYASEIELPIEAKEGRVEDYRKGFLQSLEQLSLGKPDVWVRPLLTRRFNSLLKHHNKSGVEFLVIMEIIERLLEKYPDFEIFIDVDKLGGRERYSELLASYFPFAKIDIIQEVRRQSQYVLPDRGLHIRFCQQADRTSFTVASASLVAKLTREIFMAHLNTWWGQEIDGLKPTAGYPQDASRWLEVVRPHLFEKGYNESWIVREK